MSISPISPIGSYDIRKPHEVSKEMDSGPDEEMKTEVETGISDADLKQEQDIVSEVCASDGFYRDSPSRDMEHASTGHALEKPMEHDAAQAHAAGFYSTDVSVSPLLFEEAQTFGNDLPPAAVHEAYATDNEIERGQQVDFLITREQEIVAASLGDDAHNELSSQWKESDLSFDVQTEETYSVENEIANEQDAGMGLSF